jgi:hypothetical protein
MRALGATSVALPFIPHGLVRLFDGGKHCCSVPASRLSPPFPDNAHGLHAACADRLTVPTAYMTNHQAGVTTTQCMLPRSFAAAEPGAANHASIARQDRRQVPVQRCNCTCIECSSTPATAQYSSTAHTVSAPARRQQPSTPVLRIPRSQAARAPTRPLLSAPLARKRTGGAPASPP